jgi:hypothetical protein
MFSTMQKAWIRHRGHSNQTFESMLCTIRAFEIRNEADDAIRCIVCGIMWIEDAIVINTTLLARNLGVGKSCINCHLKGMGYSKAKKQRSKLSSAFKRYFQDLNTSASPNIRNWTFRVTEETAELGGEDEFFNADLLWASDKFAFNLMENWFE